MKREENCLMEVVSFIDEASYRMCHCEFQWWRWSAGGWDILVNWVLYWYLELFSRDVKAVIMGFPVTSLHPRKEKEKVVEKSRIQRLPRLHAPSSAFMWTFRLWRDRLRRDIKEGWRKWNEMIYIVTIERKVVASRWIFSQAVDGQQAL